MFVMHFLANCSVKNFIQLFYMPCADSLYKTINILIQEMHYSFHMHTLFSIRKCEGENFCYALHTHGFESQCFSPAAL